MATSPTSGPGGGGSAYTAPVTREQLNGSNVSINNNASASLTWDTSSGPDVLLDRSNLALPVVLAAGVYAVTVEVEATAAMTVGGYFQVSLRLATVDEAPTVAPNSPPSTAIEVTPQVVVSMTYYIPLASGIRVQVTNFDSVGARTFALGNAIVQRVS